MKPEVVTRRIEAFHQRFGEAHLYFAYHAAFPLALTPDLLYRLWANFQRDIHGEALKIPWLAVADLLLSSLCDEVGYELYEMEIEVRNALLRELKVNTRFGEKRIHELSDFLLVYVKQQLESHDPDMRDFAQVQSWTALAYTKPGEAAREIASTLAKLKLEEKSEWIRMASIVKTFAEPLAGFEPLLIYSRAMASFVRGKMTKAVTELSKLAKAGDKLEVSGLNLSIPESLIRQIKKIIPNPFVPQNGRVEHRQQFFGRQQEIQRVFEVLNSGSSVALIGKDGIGKSSLLWEICRVAESYLQQERQAVLIDLNEVDDEKEFYIALCGELGIPETKGYVLTRNLRQRDKKVLLALDNVGKITCKAFSRRVRDQLRGLAEGGDAPLRLILAANEPLEDLFNDSHNDGKTSPLAGICQEENIQPWEDAIMRDFIAYRLKNTYVSFTEEEIIQLLQESKGHPRKLVQLCYRTYARYINDSVPEEAAQVQSPPIQKILTLQERYNLLGEKLKRLEINLVIETSPAVKFQLRKQIETSVAEIEELVQQIEKLENKL